MPRIYIVRVFERGTDAEDVRGTLVETLEFESRYALAKWFELGASMDPLRLYQVTSA